MVSCDQVSFDEVISKRNSDSSMDWKDGVDADNHANAFVLSPGNRKAESVNAFHFVAIC